MENYAFAVDANWIGGLEHSKQPRMLNRLFSGVIHPFIHGGHAFEFNSPGILAEGQLQCVLLFVNQLILLLFVALAMACVTNGTDFDAVMPRSMHSSISTGTLSIFATSFSPSDSSSGKHSFDIVSRMLADNQLAPGIACDPVKVSNAGDVEGAAFLPHKQVLERRGELIKNYASQWTVNINNNGEVKAKTEELFMLVTLLYGVAGLQSGKEFKADFYAYVYLFYAIIIHQCMHRMHLVTSSLFLPSYLPYLKPTSQTLLLRAFFAAALTIWVARGRPAPQITQFYARTKSRFTIHGPVPKPGPDALAPADAITPNPWLYALQSTLVHPDEHLAKCMRSLAHFAHVLGGAPAGTWAGQGLSGDEVLDGTVFVRVASLTMDFLGWVREGAEKKGVFDFSAFWD